MSNREQVINDLQRQIEELEERLAIALEGQPEAVAMCKDCKHGEKANDVYLAESREDSDWHMNQIGSVLTGKGRTNGH